MKPVLIVEGIRKNVVSVNFDETGVVTQVMIENAGDYEFYNVDKSNDAELIWEGRHAPVLDTLNAHLKESERYLQELKNRIADEVIGNDIEGLPFPEHSKVVNGIVEEYRNHLVYIEGLVASIEFVQEYESVVSSTDE